MFNKIRRIHFVITKLFMIGRRFEIGFRGREEPGHFIRYLQVAADNEHRRKDYAEYWNR